MKRINEIIILIAWIAIIVLMVVLGMKRPAEKIEYEIKKDTIYMRDTVRLPVPPPERIYIARTDTVFVTVSDTVLVPVYLTVERKTYKTEDYEAVIEGYKPELLSMTVYPQVKTIYNTEIRTVKKNTRFGIGVQVGYGFTQEKIAPYVGIGVQYNLINF